MLLLLALGGIAFQAWSWRHLTAHAIRGGLTRSRAALLYALLAFLPLALFASFLAGTVALEEALDVALVSEGLARATPLLAALLIGQATLGSIAFGIRCAFIEGSKPLGP